MASGMMSLGTISWGLAAGGLASIALASSAYADTASLRTLLNEGFEIKSSNVISADVIQRAVNNSKWVDDYLVTLQRGNQIAFCHVALGCNGRCRNVCRRSELHLFDGDDGGGTRRVGCRAVGAVVRRLEMIEVV